MPTITLEQMLDELTVQGRIWECGNFRLVKNKSHIYSLQEYT